MRKYLVLLWLLLPLPFVVLHYGRGQQWLARDQANDLVRKAWSAEQKNDWKAADSLYREAARLAAKDQPHLRLGLDLAQVRTRFRMGEAVTAIDMAERLVNDPAMTAAPQALQREARDLSARIHYYAAWVMRLEGANRGREHRHRRDVATRALRAGPKERQQRLGRRLGHGMRVRVDQTFENLKDHEGAPGRRIMRSPSGSARGVRITTRP